MRALAELGQVDLAYVPLGGEEPSSEYKAIESVEFHRIVPSRGARRAAVYLSARARGVPDSGSRGVSPELVEQATRLAEQPGRGRVVAGDLNAATALLPLARRRPVIFNAHNVGAAYRHSGHNERPWTRLLYRRYERELFTVAEESWMVSRADMEAALALAPTARLRYVPNAVDVAAIRPVAPRPNPPRRVLMVADHLYPPNASGRAFLVEDVLPRVWRELPDARLTLAGRGLETWKPPDPRIDVAGFVEDLDEVYQAAGCIAVPLLEGGGSPLKFVEGLARGVPVVATPFAARGLEVEPDRHYLEGADAGAFAAAVVRVLGGEASELAAAARRLAEVEYSVEALAERLAAPIEAPGAERTATPPPST